MFKSEKLKSLIVLVVISTLAVTFGRRAVLAGVERPYAPLLRAPLAGPMPQEKQTPIGGFPTPDPNATPVVIYTTVQVLATPLPPAPTRTPTPTPTATPVPPPILLVDDDNGLSYEGYYTAALDALDKEYDLWVLKTQDSPPASTLQQYDIVLWFASPPSPSVSPALTSEDQANLVAYLNGGGSLFITGQDIGYYLNKTGSTFLGNYLHATYIKDDTNTYGLTGKDILSGVNVNISGGDGANNQAYPSEIGLKAGAVGLYDYAGSYTWGALRWQGAYKVVYFAFGYEAINSAASRTSVMDKVLTWLE